MAKKAKNLETKENLSQKPLHPAIQVQDMKDGRTRLRVQFDITYKGHQGATIEGESITEPDLTLRLGQLLERHSRGKDIPMKPPLYFDTEIPTFNDITDIHRYKEQLERRLQETKTFIQQEQDEKKTSDYSNGDPIKTGQQLELQDDPNYTPRTDEK